MSVYHRPNHRISGPDLAGSQTVAQATKGIEVVYYVRLPDGRIKIGTSTDLLPRLAKHRRKYGRITVLAIEFGGRDLESERHRQFSHLRSRGEREIFQPGEELMTHIRDACLT